VIGERLQKLGSRERVALALAGLCVGVLLLDRLAVAPLFAQLRVFEEGIRQVDGAIRYNRSVLRQAATVAAEYRKVEGLTGKALKPDEVIDRMKARIDELSKQAGLTISSMEQREPRHEKFHDIYQIEIGSFEAKVPRLIQFLCDLEAAPGLLRVTRLNFENATGERVRGSCVITMAVVRP
jgi:hypothetical protein